ncbi:MAG: flagellar type III secretion system pore protein FliP [Planctomycetes bacterium]|nr:flagellar type III secretion system pore protein FliP [Planctomycetota bacterium]
MKRLFQLLTLLLALAAPLAAQAPDPVAPPAPATAFGPPAPSSGQGPGVTLSLRGGDGRENLSSALEIVLLMTLLAMAPALVMTMTCFTRIVVVLSFLKRAMSMQDLPPAMITTGFALFMTIFVMKPVVSDVYDQAYLPYVENRMDWREAAGIATTRMNQFMLAQTREEDVALILDLSRTPRPATALETPFHVTVPAFVLSEIKTAFQMGFVLFLPFVVIDLVISAILVSMGMFSLPPVVVSTPLKLLLFILVGGWDLVVVSLAESFTT